MIKILGISCSPRKMGNSDIILKEISNRITVEHEFELLRLHDYTIDGCNACYKCLSGNETCVIEDDLNKIIEIMSNADAYILAVPTYFLGPNSILKRLLDRGLSFYAKSKLLWHKPAVGIAISGINNKDGYTKLGIENFLKIMMCDIKGIDVFTAAYPAEIVLNEINLDKIDRMSKALLGESMVNIHKPKCNLCGSSNFEFIDHNKIRCLCCSNFGSFKQRENNIEIMIEPDDHPLFLSDDMALEHREWLVEMKQKFIYDIPKLKKIRDKYR